MKHFLKLLAVAIVMAVVTFAGPPAFAGPLEDAKASGLVGEQFNGYLGVVSGSAPADVQRLVDEINLKRREVYRQTAERSGANLQEVEALSGKKLVERASRGEFVRLPDGRWLQQR